MWREIVETMGDENIAGWVGGGGRGDERTAEPAIELWATSALSLHTGGDEAAAGANSCRLPPSPYNYSGVIVALHPHLLLSAY